MSNSSLKRKLNSSNEVNSLLNRSEILNNKLSHRPERHQLVEQRILLDSHCAPSLQNAEYALKRARLADELNNRLLNRPGPLDLIQHNILHIDTNEHPDLEEAIQGGQIPFKATSSYHRPLIFHEYTGSPSLCKPKVTKVDSLSSTSNTHHIRLAQQQLLLELTSNKQNEQEILLPKKSLEQMTLVELKELCKKYQIPSSHTNKTKLIERIKQVQNKINKQEVLTLENNSNEFSNTDLNPSLQISNINDEEIELFSTSELDEILKSFPMNFINRGEEDQNNIDIQNLLIDPQIINNDDLFVEMLLNNDYSSTSTSDDLFFSDILPINSSPLPRITSIDEFDAFLRDFTYNSSSKQQQQQQQEVLPPIS
ncbi:unnamed protein product [Adineta steineri]|uniref:SAP domain-containing protein n=1 Tax=Adineta steineri TaxID=433720 RepID=A0A814TDL6_9BILA|nr:unnamed protein product [Adineta steineri]CAF1356137.1 unnamed protein product [Adineta steineri]